ncbi:MAG: chromosome segregation protein SMC [Lachnospiraceae bacterium]|jgi:chromosome segregation protein
MYLKSIEIQGFKSFANKIVFEFHNGITGIVGPNGSGKSNVADAVRWVLGEQRVKQLRGASMQDVIFSGTELRKPQGFAYVAITLDNGDHKLAIEYDEVTVSRRLYRSGESEYRINGSPCRLKDINELFYDTGIGKEGYSIIGQGQIDKILSGKPEERRELFDEAAGIVKFKRRKAIAQKKLEDERQSLVRVNDILSELEKQVGPLEKQSQAAREYLRLKENLKHLDANLFLAETSSLKGQIESVSKNESIVSQDLERVQKEAETIRSEYDTLDAALTVLDEKVTAGRSAQAQETLKRGNLEGQINVLKEQINTERMNAEHIRHRMESIKAEIAQREGEISGYETEKEALSVQVSKVLERQKEAELSLMEEDILIGDTEGALEQLKQSVIDTLNEKASVNAKDQRYEAMLEQVNMRKAEVSQKLLKSKSDESVQDEQIAEKQTELDEITEKIQDVLLKETELEEQVQTASTEGKRLNRLLSEHQQTYHRTNTKLESLRNLAERYEGYGQSIRRVMEVKDRVRGIHGVVADLITAEKKYEVAIETALGGSIQNIVTDSEETAKTLIEYLKKNKFGRATFLPLTSIGNRSTFNQDRALTEKGVLGLANQLVKADKQYEGLLKYLLGRVVVVDTIDNAIALSRKYQYSLRIVTLEGELLNAGGSMTGGAFKNTSNLLGRKREIEELEHSCKTVLEEIDKANENLVFQEELLKGLNEELEENRKNKQSLYLDQNTIRLGIRQLEAKKTEIAESASDMVTEHRQLEEQVREITSSRMRLMEETSRLEAQGEKNQEEIQNLSGVLETYRQKREILAKDLSAVQMETAGLQQKDNFLKENIRRVQEEIRKVKEELSGLTEGSGESGLVIQGKEEEIARIEKEMKDGEQLLETLKEEILSLSQEKEETARRQKGFFDKREELSRQVSGLDKDLFRLQGQKEKLEERMESCAAYMWNEYELTYTTAEELRDENQTSIPEMKKDIEGMKAQIKGLGNVNVNAIEDYKEVSERYEFLKTQHDDLVTAEQTLIQIIEELDTGMRRQFEQQFALIRKEFDKVFKELFGGGRGTLELMEGEDILEAGIQIISQPPGKKLQNMMQLSGGEKALTAIALLFAIQNLKPSPFCLLDEIEAALDDSNVDRFAGYLHKLTANTQFIVITHRRGTMVSADRLYGITMQEKGVSALVSVNLIEADLEN